MIVTWKLPVAHKDQTMVTLIRVDGFGSENARIPDISGHDDSRFGQSQLKDLIVGKLAILARFDERRTMLQATDPALLAGACDVVCKLPWLILSRRNSCGACLPLLP